MTVVNEREGKNLTKVSISMSMSAAPILAALIFCSSFLLAPAESSNQQNSSNANDARIRRPLTGAGNGARASNLAIHKPGTVLIMPEEFLDAHNKVRKSLGEPLLQWDKELAEYSRNFAIKRVDDCKMIHSYGPYGENIFWGEVDTWSPSEIVKMWVDENKHYDAAKNECAPQQVCGHYTQVVWADTTRLGCAQVTCNNGGIYAICSYDPPGNYVNESPFDRHST